MLKRAVTENVAIRISRKAQRDFVILRYVFLLALLTFHEHGENLACAFAPATQ
jgi:hypothetical protein